MTATARFTLVAALLAGTASLATAAHAASAIGLVDGKTLVMFDTETRAVSGTMDWT